VGACECSTRVAVFGLTNPVIYAIFPAAFWPARGVSLIQKTKSHRMPADVSSGRERRIPLLHGSKDPFACVSEGLERVEENLARAIRSREQDLTDISAHLILSGGKRVRPMVTLLAYSAFGGQDTQDIVDIATAIELIHTATLLHDDIIDGAETRRGKESAYKKFGLKSTLVAGDFLFIKAFEFAGKFDETVVQWTADACTLLYLDEGAYARLVADAAAVEVYEAVDFNVAPERNVGRDARELGHQPAPLPPPAEAVSAPSGASSSE